MTIIRCCLTTELSGHHADAAARRGPPCLTVRSNALLAGRILPLLPVTWFAALMGYRDDRDFG